MRLSAPVSEKFNEGLKHNNCENFPKLLLLSYKALKINILVCKWAVSGNFYQMFSINFQTVDFCFAVEKQRAGIATFQLFQLRNRHRKMHRV